VLGTIDEGSNKLSEIYSLFKIRTRDYTEVLVIWGGREIRSERAIRV